MTTTLPSPLLLGFLLLHISITTTLLLLLPRLLRRVLLRLLPLLLQLPLLRVLAVTSFH